MHDETETEHVTDRIVFGFHIFDVDDFRSDVARSTTSNEKILVNLRKLSETEVSNDQIPTILRPEN